MKYNNKMKVYTDFVTDEFQKLVNNPFSHKKVTAVNRQLWTLTVEPELTKLLIEAVLYYMAIFL